MSLAEALQEIKYSCYYCPKYTFDILKFIAHLDWHSAIVEPKDSRLHWDRIVEDSSKKVKNLYWIGRYNDLILWEDRNV